MVDERHIKVEYDERFFLNKTLQERNPVKYEMRCGLCDKIIYSSENPPSLDPHECVEGIS